jgi:hypothetical protein
MKAIVNPKPGGPYWTPITPKTGSLFHAESQLNAKANHAKAVNYALGRWEDLALYTTDGRIGIDNNAAERALRGIAITRKNYLFLGSEAGGDRAAIIYTVLETAKLNRLDPEAYLANIIDRMAKGHPANRLTELLPWNWKHHARPAPSPETA